MRALLEWIIEKLGGIPASELHSQIQTNKKLREDIEELKEEKKNIELVSDSWRERAEYFQNLSHEQFEEARKDRVNVDRLIDLLVTSKTNSKDDKPSDFHPPDLQPIRTTTMPWSRARRELEKKDRESIKEKDAKVS